MCDNCEHNNSSDSGFIFGIIIGAIIGAVVAIYIYKNNQSEVFVDLKNKLSKYFSPPSPKTPPRPAAKKTEKKTVTLPHPVESIDLTPTPKPKPRKMFVKK